MFIDDYIENISLKEELKNIKEQLKTVQDENTKLKMTIDLHRKADAEKTEKIKRLSEELDALKYTKLISDEDWLKYRLSIRDAINTAVVNNFKNRIKDLENEIDRLKSNPSTVSDSELRAIHTADVETINKLNIRAHDVKKKVQQLKDIINDLSEEL